MCGFLFTVANSWLEGMCNIATHTEFFDQVKFLRFLQYFMNIHYQWMIDFLQDVKFIKELSVTIDIDHLCTFGVSSLSILTPPYTWSGTRAQWYAKVEGLSELFACLVKARPFEFDVCKRIGSELLASLLIEIEITIPYIEGRRFQQMGIPVLQDDILRRIYYYSDLWIGFHFFCGLIYCHLLFLNFRFAHCCGFRVWIRKQEQFWFLFFINHR